MTPTKLTKCAESLREFLEPQVSCYFTVGWMQDPALGDRLTVFFDQRASLSLGVIPEHWQGLPVFTQATLPPGVSPEVVCEPSLDIFL